MWAVVVTEAAELDINAAAVWYEREAVGLGNPQQFALVYDDKRRALLKRLPYGLYFRVEPTVAVVVGCFHGHRNPKAWQSRR